MAKPELHKGKTRRNHATWAYEKARKQRRQEKVLEGLEKRLKLSDLELTATAKRFKGRSPGDIASEEINTYRAYIKEQILTLKDRMSE